MTWPEAAFGIAALSTFAFVVWCMTRDSARQVRFPAPPIIRQPDPLGTWRYEKTATTTKPASKESRHDAD